jgi:hypothetical protein
MSGITIEDELGAGEMPHGGQSDDSVPMDDSPVDRGRFDFSFLKAQTGEGSIESYLQSPLNFNESRAVARILRGLQGMVGNMDYAIVDISVGILDYMRGRRGNVD